MWINETLHYLFDGQPHPLAAKMEAKHPLPGRVRTALYRSHGLHPA